jgi:hypothetical protein
MLRRTASLFAILLLLMTAAPVMACMTDQQMVQSKNTCCQMMHGKCGEMAKTGCCRVEVRDQEPQMASHATVVSFHWVVLTIVSFDLATPQTGLPARWLAPDEHSPPLPLSTKPTVLRI